MMDEPGTDTMATGTGAVPVADIQAAVPVDAIRGETDPASVVAQAVPVPVPGAGAQAESAATKKTPVTSGFQLPAPPMLERVDYQDRFDPAAANLVKCHKNNCFEALKIFAKYINPTEELLRARDVVPPVLHVATAKDAMQTLQRVMKQQASAAQKKAAPPPHCRKNAVLQDTVQLAEITKAMTAAADLPMRPSVSNFCKTIIGFCDVLVDQTRFPAGRVGLSEASEGEADDDSLDEPGSRAGQGDNLDSRAGADKAEPVMNWERLLATGLKCERLARQTYAIVSTLYKDETIMTKIAGYHPASAEICLRCGMGLSGQLDPRVPGSTYRYDTDVFDSLEEAVVDSVIYFVSSELSRRVYADLKAMEGSGWKIPNRDALLGMCLRGEGEGRQEPVVRFLCRLFLCTAIQKAEVAALVTIGPWDERWGPQPEAWLENLMDDAEVYIGAEESEEEEGTEEEEESEEEEGTEETGTTVDADACDACGGEVASNGCIRQVMNFRDSKLQYVYMNRDECQCRAHCQVQGRDHDVKFEVDFEDEDQDEDETEFEEDDDVEGQSGDYLQFAVSKARAQADYARSIMERATDRLRHEQCVYRDQQRRLDQQRQHTLACGGGGGAKHSTRAAAKTKSRIRAAQHDANRAAAVLRRKEEHLSKLVARELLVEDDNEREQEEYRKRFQAEKKRQKRLRHKQAKAKARQEALQKKQEERAEFEAAKAQRKKRRDEARQAKEAKQAVQAQIQMEEQRLKDMRSAKRVARLQRVEQERRDRRLQEEHDRIVAARAKQQRLKARAAAMRRAEARREAQAALKQKKKQEKRQRKKKQQEQQRLKKEEEKEEKAQAEAQAQAQVQSQVQAQVQVQAEDQAQAQGPVSDGDRMRQFQRMLEAQQAAMEEAQQQLQRQREEIDRLRMQNMTGLSSSSASTTPVRMEANQTLSSSAPSFQPSGQADPAGQAPVPEMDDAAAAKPPPPPPGLYSPGLYPGTGDAGASADGSRFMSFFGSDCDIAAAIDEATTKSANKQGRDADVDAFWSNTTMDAAVSDPVSN